MNKKRMNSMYLNWLSLMSLSILISLGACSKDVKSGYKKIINEQLVIDAFGPEQNIPFSLDVDNNGIYDVVITGNGSFSGSSGSRRELFIQGVNGSKVCFNTQYDTSWVVDVFTGSNDTLTSYNSFMQPNFFELGDYIESSLEFSDSKLIIYQFLSNGSMGPSRSNTNRGDVITGSFIYFIVETPSGLHWIKCKPDTPESIIESCSILAEDYGMSIHE